MKGEPPSQEEAFEVDLDSIRDNKADIKPFIKQEMDIKPDISGSIPIIGDAVSEAEVQQTEGETEGQPTEEETEEQPAKKRKIDHEEQEKVGLRLTVFISEAIDFGSTHAQFDIDTF